MNVADWRRAGCASLLTITAATAQGCELRPSREFAPPTTLTAGPPLRGVAPARAEGVMNVESPTPPAVEWIDGVREQVIVRTLKNGMTLHVAPRSDIPSATVLLVLGTKVIPSPSPVAQVYTQAALRAGPLPWSRRQTDGAMFFTVASRDFVALGVTALSPVIDGVLARFLPETIEAEIFDAHVDGAREDLIASVAGYEPSRRAFMTSLGSLFPIPHPYGWAAAAILPGSFRAVKTKEVRAFRAASFTTDNMTVVAAGNVDVDALAATLDRALVNMPNAPVAKVDVLSPRPSCAGRVLLENDVGARQSSVSITYPAVPATHPDAAALEVLAAAAGGSLATRLNVSLRHERGVTNGFGAALAKMREGGAFSVRGDVDPARTAEALRVLSDELDALGRTPLGADDLRLAKITAAHAMSRLDGAATAMRLAEATILGIPMSGTSAVEGVTAEQVRAAAERYLLPAQRCIVVVGDAARLERELKPAGLGPVSRPP